MDWIKVKNPEHHRLGWMGRPEHLETFPDGQQSGPVN
jgi:hypothetical protein